MNEKRIKMIKRIIVKDPRLKVIRDNFRIIIKLAVQDKYTQLRSLEGLYVEKLMKNKRLTPTQFRRSVYLHKIQEILVATFVNSICVCASNRTIFNSDIKGDRVRYSFISEFDKNFSKKFGACYIVEERWYSLEYYEKNKIFLEEYFRKMVNRTQQFPGSILTLYELHQQSLNDLEIMYLKDKLKENQKKVLRFPDVILFIVNILKKHGFKVVSVPFLLKKGLMQIQKGPDIFDVKFRVSNVYTDSNKDFKYLERTPKPRLLIDNIKSTLEKALADNGSLLSSGYYDLYPRKFKILFIDKDLNELFSLKVSNAVRYSDLISSNLGFNKEDQKEVKLVNEIL